MGRIGDSSELHLDHVMAVNEVDEANKSLRAPKRDAMRERTPNTM